LIKLIDIVRKLSAMIAVKERRSRSEIIKESFQKITMILCLSTKATIKGAFNIQHEFAEKNKKGTT